MGVLPVDDEGRVWLVGQYRYPLESYSWEIPEGGSPESRVPRGNGAPGAPRGDRPEGRPDRARGHRPLSNSVSDELGYVFRATELTPGPDEPEGCEKIVVRPFEWDEAWGMLGRGEITDSLSVIALLHEAVRRLERPRSE